MAGVAQILAQPFSSDIKLSPNFRISMTSLELTNIMEEVDGIPPDKVSEDSFKTTCDLTPKVIRKSLDSKVGEATEGGEVVTNGGVYVVEPSAPLPESDHDSGPSAPHPDSSDRLE